MTVRRLIAFVLTAGVTTLAACGQTNPVGFDGGDTVATPPAAPTDTTGFMTDRS
jgi:predicted small lipoprotein YifL